jgi:hypothetical protein
MNRIHQTKQSSILPSIFQFYRNTDAARGWEREGAPSEPALKGIAWGLSTTSPSLTTSSHSQGSTQGPLYATVTSHLLRDPEGPACTPFHSPGAPCSDPPKVVEGPGPPPSACASAGWQVSGVTGFIKREAGRRKNKDSRVDSPCEMKNST